MRMVMFNCLGSIQVDTYVEIAWHQCGQYLFLSSFFSIMMLQIASVPKKGQQ